MSISIESSTNESMSALLGWISIACWYQYNNFKLKVTRTETTFEDGLLMTQIYENCLHKSGEGVSISAVVIWMIGDLTNFFGAAKQHLLDTMIILSVYHTFCDLVLLLQIFYFRWYHRQEAAAADGTLPGSDTGQLEALDESRPALNPSDSEVTPLLSRNLQLDNNNTTTMQSSRTLSSRIHRGLAYCFTGLPSFFAAYGLILFIGLLGWWFSRTSPGPEPGDGLPSVPREVRETWDLSAQIMGWISAGAYLSSRVPQILKNQVTKCHGLSLLFFLVGLLHALYFLYIYIYKKRKSLSSITLHHTPINHDYFHNLSFPSGPAIYIPYGCVSILTKNQLTMMMVFMSFRSWLVGSGATVFVSLNNVLIAEGGGSTLPILEIST
ncbi:hypothetical protein VP01_196g1 [Puccinia sorghi]|uniref:Uncharacterized protein n=1 Tax=Puccinia sorghi TaxID=27349 RepID=A0A0L6VCC2_9BASI|nr:hypothetical protein VP01_196g1 [Puccinia sorghi]